MGESPHASRATGSYFRIRRLPRKTCHRQLFFSWKPSRVRFLLPISSFGDPWGNRTPVIGVRGRCLNRLTNGPFLPPAQRPEPFPTPGPTSFFGAPSGALPPAGQHATGILPSRPFLATRLSGPLLSEKIVYHFFFGAPSGARTRDTLIKSQVLYQLS